ncbi:MAG: winged helix-turn-helix transcriptional regulator [Deltaproteobacteria bacterium]|nr:winged helix-turn-helix transcriptional regulator [Deltaproteobacteria bacterium]
MTGFSRQISENLQALAWSLWTELGVRGVVQNHKDCAIDPEPLILFTAWLKGADPRLRDESIDWCLGNLRLISVARLKNLLKAVDQDSCDDFFEYASIVNSNSPARWPLAKSSPPKKFRRSKKSALADLGRPALIHLRLRSLFGVGARAEIIAALLARPGLDMSSSDLARLNKYTKRNVADIMESLKTAGLVKAIRTGNQVRYRFDRRQELIDLIGSLPSVFPSWTSIFQLLYTIRRVSLEFGGKKHEVAGVEAHQALNEMVPLIEQLDLAAPPQQSDATLYWKAFVTWALQLTGSLASGKSQLCSRRSPPGRNRRRQSKK